MEINNTALFSFPTSAFSSTRPAGASNLPPGKAVPANFQRVEKEEIIRQFPSDFITLQRINDAQNAVARGQRDFEKRFQKLDDSLERMKEHLAQITTQFPPFPPGSKDRVRALRAYTYFRNLIDQLTIPPREEVQSGKMMDGLINTSATFGAGKKVVSDQPTNSNHLIETSISS
jgi:hypothetical protein